MKNVFRFNTSKREKRILILEDEKLNEVRFTEKSGITNLGYSKRVTINLRRKIRSFTFNSVLPYAREIEK